MAESRQNLIEKGQALGLSPVSVLDLETNITTEYISIAQAARELGLSLNSLECDSGLQIILGLFDVVVALTLIESRFAKAK